MDVNNSDILMNINKNNYKGIDWIKLRKYQQDLENILENISYITIEEKQMILEIFNTENGKKVFVFLLDRSKAILFYELNESFNNLLEIFNIYLSSYENNKQYDYLSIYIILNIGCKIHTKVNN